MAGLRPHLRGPRPPTISQLLLQGERPLLSNRIHIVALDHIEQRIGSRTAPNAAGKRILESQVGQEWSSRLPGHRRAPGGTGAPRRIEDIGIGAGVTAHEIVVNSPTAADHRSAPGKGPECEPETVR